MPGVEKIWDTEADWETWTQLDDNAEITEAGAVRVKDGAMWTNIRLLYEAVGATPIDIGGGTYIPSFTDLILEGVHETNTAYCIRFRTGATGAAAQAATWSAWQNGYDPQGTIEVNLFQQMLNTAALNSGPWIELDLFLRTD